MFSLKKNWQAALKFRRLSVLVERYYAEADLKLAFIRRGLISDRL